MDLEALRLAEAFFARKPEALPSVRAVLLGALERWPETKIVTQKSQVGLRDPRPYCALTAPGKLTHLWKSAYEKSDISAARSD